MLQAFKIMILSICIMSMAAFRAEAQQTLVNDNSTKSQMEQLRKDVIDVQQQIQPLSAQMRQLMTQVKEISGQMSPLLERLKADRAQMRELRKQASAQGQAQHLQK